MNHDRRTVLAAMGLALPFAPLPAFGGQAGKCPALKLRSFEEGVREAFSAFDPSGTCRRIEVGHGDIVHTGIQGCHNDRPFAGFSAGRLRIVRVGSEPGPEVGGVRLYVCTVEVALTDSGEGSRRLDFASLPPAAILTSGEPSGVNRRVEI